MSIRINSTEVFNSLGEIPAGQVTNIPEFYGPTGIDGPQGLVGIEGPQGAQGPQGDLLYGANCTMTADCIFGGSNCTGYREFWNCSYYNCYDCNYSA